MVSKKHDAEVVECWNDQDDNIYYQSIEAIGQATVLMGGPGSVWLEAGLERSFFVAGGKAMVRVSISNGSKQGVSGIRLGVSRTLAFPSAQLDRRPALTATEVVHTQHYRGQEFEFAAGSHIILNLPIEIPSDVRTIRKTGLFEVSLGLIVGLSMGSFAKNLEVKLPIHAAHVASLQTPLDGIMNNIYAPADWHWQGHQPQHHHQQMHHEQHHVPQPHFATVYIPRSQSAMGHYDAHMTFPIPPSISAAPWPAPEGMAVISLPSTPLHFQPQVQGQGHDGSTRVDWQSPAHGWVSSQPNLRRSPSQAAAPLGCSIGPLQARYSRAVQDRGTPTDGQTFSQRPQHVASTQSSTRDIDAPKPVPQNEEQGLTTINEDSESAANTVKSVWAPRGYHTEAKRSVLPANVDLFERLANLDVATSMNGPAEDEEEEYSKEPAGKAVQQVSAPADESFLSSHPRLSSMDPASANAIHQGQLSPPLERPSKVLLHVQSSQAPAPNAAKGQSSKETVTPWLKNKTHSIGVANVQSDGLAALERMLKPDFGNGMRKQNKSSKGEPARAESRGIPRSTSGQGESRGALRNAALDRQRRAQKELAAKGQRSKSASSGDVEVKACQSAARSKFDAGADGLDSTADEATQLGKEAVRLVFGCLESSGSADAPKATVSISEEHANPMLTSKTSISSALLGSAEDVATVPRVKSRGSQALGGGSLGIIASTANVAGGSAAARMTRSSSGTNVASRYELALQKMSQGSPTANIESKGRGLAGESKSNHSPNLPDKSTPSASSSGRAASIFWMNAYDSAGTTSSDHTNATKQSSPPLAVAHGRATKDSGGGHDRHEGGSVRGDRGGRVVSVASLWASISNGTDGKLVPDRSLLGVNTSMRRTMVNARPQARRLMNGEAPTLDFTSRVQVEAAMEAEAGGNGSERGETSAGPARQVVPKAIRPKARNKSSAIPIPSMFSGHPQNQKTSGVAGEESFVAAAGSGGKNPPRQAHAASRRAAPPFLNTTVPKVYLWSKDHGEAASVVSAGRPGGNAGGFDNADAEVKASLSAPAMHSVSGRGTTRAVGKERLNELRSMFAA